ncbi:hypothetical protein C475_05955 [Halosimplex carlsbadense 2-9-1]|uniref:Lipoprotein n=1 Tax=Halosimplex carlsbadense 2-9-1 TaxID=797114 RepID=M0CZX6_9EURY|nr:hypothetical protein [Halosimplex carlsbadense]ELZ27439.1 hypothetical protein C475_05955 [Halosimplex carlsbadense 2-9-1]
MNRPPLHLAIAACVLLAGCSVLGADHTRQERAVEALADARDAANATDGYRFDGDLRVVATADGETERVEIGMNGTVDTAERRMHSTSVRDRETYESYLINRTAYRECGGPIGMDMWGVENVTTDDWTMATPAARQLALLESGSLFHNGTRTLDGEAAVLLVGHPTTEALTKYQERRDRSLLGGPSVENAEVRVWLDAETHRPLRSAVRFEVSQGGNSASATVDMRFDDHGSDLSVDVPVIPDDQTWGVGCPG